MSRVPCLRAVQFSKASCLQIALLTTSARSDTSRFSRVTTRHDSFENSGPTRIFDGRQGSTLKPHLPTRGCRQDTRHSRTRVVYSRSRQLDDLGDPGHPPGSKSSPCPGSRPGFLSSQPSQHRSWRPSGAARSGGIHMLGTRWRATTESRRTTMSTTLRRLTRSSNLSPHTATSRSITTAITTTTTRVPELSRTPGSRPSTIRSSSTLPNMSCPNTTRSSWSIPI